MPDSKRYLGLELAGARNQKTSLAVLEYYPSAEKVFLLEIHDRFSSERGETADEALLNLIHREKQGVSKIGVNVSLQLPPCIPCTRASCPMPSRCTVPAVKWGRNTLRKHQREFIPYTQRPVEAWIRYHVLPDLPVGSRFEIDETLGGSRAPLTARMHFLKHHLKGFDLLETWPKLTVALLCQRLDLHRRTASSYRNLEEGGHAREEILTSLCKKYRLFIYEKDLRKLSQSLTAFDAFVCAYTSLLFDQKRCAKIPKGFPVSSGWVVYPDMNRF